MTKLNFYPQYPLRAKFDRHQIQHVRYPIQNMNDCQKLQQFSQELFPFVHYHGIDTIISYMLNIHPEIHCLHFLHPH